MTTTRRSLLAGAGAATLLPWFRNPASADSQILSVSTRTLDVKGRAATVFGVTGQSGRQGVFAREGERFSGVVRNGTKDPLVMHWHGQVQAAFDQDRSRPNGGELAPGAEDRHDFMLTAGTHWMHAHQLSEQQLLAAPMITIERNAPKAQEVVLMLHDFSFRPPAEILSTLGGSAAHSGHAATSGSTTRQGTPGGMDHGGGGKAGVRPGGGMMPGIGSMGGMRVHANDVQYDAYLANDRTLDDPDVVRVEKGGSVRLRIINGGTATAFFVDTGALDAECIAVDGSRCYPLRGRLFPLAQGQRIDLMVSIPAAGGAFPIFAQVEADRRRTGIVLATAGAAIAKLDGSAKETAPNTTLSLDERLRAHSPLRDRKPDRTFHLMLGEEAGYRWTINGKVHGQHEPLNAKIGERIEIMFMNPTSMMHPMHLHGHHFQVVGTRAGRFSGPVRDTIIVPPHTPVVVAVDLDKAGDWFLHCHHLYHMATGMMTDLRVS